jgi:hypothetical protein
MVLTVSSALSLVTGLCCHHRGRNRFHQLDASVGASGPHGFAVREPGAFVNAPPHVHRIPPHVRDDRETPLVEERDGGGYAGDLGQMGTEIFLRAGLDR